MLARSGMISLAALSLTALGLTALPVVANAQTQDNDQTASGAKEDAANKKVNLELESTNLYYALKLLFAQIKANFVIDESLRSLTVTAHLTQVPFRVALETLLKSTNTPLTYTVDNGIYNVKPKAEEPNEPQSTDTGTKEPELKSDGSRIQKIHSTSLSFNAIDIVQAFGGKVITVGNVGQFGNGGLGGGQGGLGGGLGGFGGGGLGGFGGGLGGGLGGFGGGMGGFGGGLGGFGGGGLGGYGGGGLG